MYYCPCPCSDPTDPDCVEENTYTFTLPRNLSYVQESFLDAHNVSGRFVFNPRTERRIAAANSAALASDATSSAIDADPTNGRASFNGSNIQNKFGDDDDYDDYDDDENYPYYRQFFNDNRPHHHQFNNGVASRSENNGISSNHTTIKTSTNTTAASIPATHTSIPKRWSADGTKVELGFEGGIIPPSTGTFTGKRDSDFSLTEGDFESRQQQEVINRQTNIGTWIEKKGEGEIEETVGGFKKKGDSGDNICCNRDEIEVSTVLTSTKDPAILVSSISSLHNVSASDFSNTKSSAEGDGDAFQSQKDNGLSLSSLSLCESGVNNNNSSSSSCHRRVSQSEVISGSSPTTIATINPTSQSFISLSSCSSHPSSPAPNSNANTKSSSSSSSSKSSFLKRVTSLLSPKEDDGNINVSVNLSHQQAGDLGSSVDAESIPTITPTTATCSDPDATDPSQPFILRSPDRSGLVMDRGEDLSEACCSNTDHDDEQTVLISCSTISNSNSENSSSILKSMQDITLHPMGQSVLDEGCVSGGYSGVEVAMAYHHREGGHSAPDPTEGSDVNGSCSDMSNPNDGGKGIPPPDYYCETAEESSTSSFGVVMSDSDKLLVVESHTETATVTTMRAESPQGASDSDAFSEEGVFVNMIDDDVTVEMGRRASDVSDDTVFSVDTMLCTPEEKDREETKKMNTGDEEKESDDNEGGSSKKQLVRQMSLEEAISRAASDFQKITEFMYPDVTSDEPKPSTSKGFERRERSERLAKLARGCPAHGLPTLNVRTTTVDASSSSEVDPTSEQDQHSPVSTGSPVYEDNEFNFNKKTLRKSSSLKTNKTPPGTPHRKKVVRFADAMGLDLESVRHVLNAEAPPKIPASAMADLHEGLSDDRLEVGSRFLTPCFTQPGATNSFVSTVIAQKVRLENAIITDLTITGFIRVSNIAFHKSVRVRYTHNRWATFHDIAASYIPDSCDGPTDRFSFSIVAPAHFMPGDRLEFAVSYNAGETEYWDNNGGQNYVFECFAKTVPTENDREWIHFL